MKKRLLWMLIGLFASMVVCAQPITREKAMQMANEFLQNKQGSRRLAPVTSRAKLAPARRGVATAPVAYHVFNRGEGEGFIIVSGDERAPEVLGYCDKGAFDYTQLPDNMRSWMDYYEEQIETLRREDSKAPARVPTHPAIKEMVTSTWNQGYPYNMNCPNYFGLGTSVTGCVATAMAQLMYYQRSKSTDRTLAEIPAYDTQTAHETFGHLHVEGIPEGSPIDWDNMRNSYSGSEPEVQREAVANLMLYCGVSVQMDYTNSSSGAYSSNVATALRNYFGYGSSVRDVLEATFSNDDWDALLYGELAAGRPFYLSGANSEVGHAFLCDGYDGNRYYHINWGWGGSSDGYYLLSNLAPNSQGIGGSTSSDGYNSGVEAIIGIEPENFTEMAVPFADAKVKTLCVTNWDANGDGVFSYGEAAQVTDLGTVFQGCTMKSFNELRNFTALESVADDAFEGCRTMTAIVLPNSVKKIGVRAFSGCRALKSLILPSGITSIGDGAFNGCRVLGNMELPSAITRIGESTFEGCAAITEMELPEGVTEIGSRAFADCSKLQTLRVHASNPVDITMGENVFENLKFTSATLIVQQGGKALFAVADQWKEFATIKERRSEPEATFVPLAAERRVFIYNVGTGRYLTKGEAWGTQAVVGNDAMQFILKHNASMPDGVYNIYSDETGNTRHLLFRTSTDDNVGTGVKAAFVDGYDEETALWSIQPVGDNRYTIQPPTGSDDYTEGQYWGVQTSHKSNVASPTYGVYYDIPYVGNEENCQWAFVDYEQTYGVYEMAKALENLLLIAEEKNVDAMREEAVFDNVESTYEELLGAQRSLRKKLKFIDFADETVRQTCVANFDLDGDGEISYTEGTMVSSLGWTFLGKSFTSFDEIKYFTNLTTLDGNSFEGCSSLTSLTLPESVARMYYRVFYNCSSLTEISIPAYINYIGFNCFSFCPSLKTVRVANPNPASIYIDETAFADTNVKAATLYVPFGSKEKYAKAPVWKEFGRIEEFRTNKMPTFSPLEEDAMVYICHVNERRYMNKGEAWGTQAVTKLTGLKYQVMRTATMPEGTYYLYSPETGKDGKVLFRTDSDSKVGTGVKACFVDGSLTEKAYWTITDMGDLRYTIQVPGADASYLGVNPDHESNNYPTYGAYWDFDYAENADRCLWAFVRVEDYNAVAAFNKVVATLKEYLDIAAQQGVDATAEQAVYDNPEATQAELEDAIVSLKGKLHFIDFADSATKSICVGAWDMNNDGELSVEEAAAVADIGETFRSKTTVRSFEELRYFTGLTSIPENAFRGCSSLMSLYLPAGVSQIGKNAFSSCSKMKYVAILHEGTLPENSTNSLLVSTATLYVPEALVEAYQADEYWSRFTTKPYTGLPVVTAANRENEYGHAINMWYYDVDGAPINGEPVLSCEVDVTSPVGDYVITVEPGSVTSAGLTCVDGKLTVIPAPLTITAKSYTRNVGEENPEFALTYRSFRNRENADVFITPPVVECDATADSPAGVYEIRVYGAEAQNYDITYVNGMLTVEDPTTIHAPIAADDKVQPIYDLQGRKVSDGNTMQKNLPKGIYIRGGKKVIVK